MSGKKEKASEISGAKEKEAEELSLCPTVQNWKSAAAAVVSAQKKENNQYPA